MPHYKRQEPSLPIHCVIAQYMAASKSSLQLSVLLFSHSGRKSNKIKEQTNFSVKELSNIFVKIK